MNDFLEIEFEFLSEQQKEMVIAFLSEMNYEGFEEEGDLLKAYIPLSLYDQNELTQLINSHQLSCNITTIKNKNWNQLWESNFHPVIVEHPVSKNPWVGIRAGFHSPFKEVEHDIIITPKMSFGTGHHATTLMMIRMMGEVDLKGKCVLDFGTGTGVLAILAEKLGAAKITAVDNDFHSIENASENFESNNCKSIQLVQGSSPSGNTQYDIILSNIVKNVILENLHAFAIRLLDTGFILISGILQEDEEAIVKSAEKNRLILHKKVAVAQWLGLQMRYSHNMI